MYQFRAPPGFGADDCPLAPAEKPTAAMCHGVSALIDVRLNGSYLISGKATTGFADVEEDAADHAAGRQVQPWRIEDAARERGANYVEGGLWKAYAVCDGRLITGQQQFSGKSSRNSSSRRWGLTTKDRRDEMDIGILGAGHIGSTVGRLWVDAGHRVRFSATNVAALEPLVKDIGPQASAGTPSEAVSFGAVVLVALPAPVVYDVLAESGPLDGKIIIHAANGFGQRAISLPALIDHLETARWVRAYNTLQARILEGEHHRDPPYTLLLSGNDAEAKAVVFKLILDSGFAPVDLGDGAASTLQDPGSPLWNNALTEDEARSALDELRTKGHTGADPLAQAVKALAERGSDDASWWLEQVTRAVFRAGMSWRVVEAKWPGFRTDFHGFDPSAVAAMDSTELKRVESDPEVIRNKRKLEATVANGRAMQELIAEHGGFRTYLSSFADPTDAPDDLGTALQIPRGLGRVAAAAVRGGTLRSGNEHVRVVPPVLVRARLPQVATRHVFE